MGFDVYILEFSTGFCVDTETLLFNLGGCIRACSTIDLIPSSTIAHQKNHEQNQSTKTCPPFVQVFMTSKARKPVLPLLCLLLFMGPSSQLDTLLPGQEIKLKDGGELVSAQGNFRLGFFKLKSNNYYLGIWYNPEGEFSVCCQSR